VLAELDDGLANLPFELSCHAAARAYLQLLACARCLSSARACPPRLPQQSEQCRIQLHARLRSLLPRAARCSFPADAADTDTRSGSVRGVLLLPSWCD
jgi:hypothetical protein